MPLFFPLAVVRHGFFFKEGSYAVAKQFVLGTEQCSWDHGAPLVIVGHGYPTEPKPAGYDRTLDTSDKK
ncbi:hypothetical protein D3C76_1031690 [compost metagenome]